MRTSHLSHDPRSVLTHASLYLLRQWRLYRLEAWQDAMSILRGARIDVDQEDEILFLETLGLPNAGVPGALQSGCDLAA